MARVGQQRHKKKILVCGLSCHAFPSIAAQFRTIDDQKSVIIFNECSELRTGIVNYEGQRASGIRSFKITRVSSSFPSTRRPVNYLAGGTANSAARDISTQIFLFTLDRCNCSDRSFIKLWSLKFCKCMLRHLN